MPAKFLIIPDEATEEIVALANLRQINDELDSAYEQLRVARVPEPIEAEIARLDRLAADVISRRAERELAQLRDQRERAVAHARRLLGEE